MEQLHLIKQIINKNAKFIFNIFLLIITYALILQTYFTNNLQKILNQYQSQYYQYYQKNKILIITQQQLKNKLKQTANNIEAIESNARYQLGFIKNGEKYYNFP